MDAVGMVVFAMFKAFGQLFGIIFDAFLVWTLDTTARRRVVARGGEADLCAIGKVERPLH